MDTTAIMRDYAYEYELFEIDPGILQSHREMPSDLCVLCDLPYGTTFYEAWNGYISQSRRQTRRHEEDMQDNERCRLPTPATAVALISRHVPLRYGGTEEKPRLPLTG